MPRIDKLTADNLRAHVNKWCRKNETSYGYDDLFKWYTQGDEYGDKVTTEWLRRRFCNPKTKRMVSRQAMDRWLRMIDDIS